MRVAATFGTKASEDRIASYEHALREVEIDPVRNPESLDAVDGLLLTGGSDVNPARYGQAKKGSGEPDDLRDELEIRLFQEALTAGIPVLGICRGLQLMNVGCGGTLVQDLPSHPQSERGEPGKHPAAHRVWIAPDSRLAAIMGAGGYDVNSRHHQAIESLGQGLEVSAIAPDGVIEGIEKPGEAFVVAVQWHPEDRILVSEGDRKLFEAFAAAVLKTLDARRATPRTSS